MENTIPLSVPPRRNPISSGMLAMVMILGAEVMFFAGLISAYIVNRSVADDMPGLQQHKLPVSVTAFNTILLVASLFTILIFSRRFKAGYKGKALLVATLLLGILFLVLQGREWITLLGIGFSTTSSIYGAFFYTIIGAHGLHVLVGIFLLLYLFLSIHKDMPSDRAMNRISICSLYWYFVVGIWPILYVLVYLT